MSTSGTIAIKHPDGQVQCVSVHGDGYLLYTGATLLHHYRSYNKVCKLLSFGSMSSISALISAPEGEEHTWRNPLRSTCVFYARDRDESMKDNASVWYDNYEEFLYDAYLQRAYIFDACPDPEVGIWTYRYFSEMNEFSVLPISLPDPHASNYLR